MSIQISDTIVVTDDQNIANGNTLLFLGNSHVKIASGNTSERPVSPENGMLRYNTSNTFFEGYANNS